MKALFLDRDGTINEDVGYAHRPEQLAWVPGAPEALRFFKERRYLLIVITNQSGIARGYYSEEEMGRFHQHMQQQLRQEVGIAIDAFYYCPHHPEAVVEAYRQVCSCRKPKTGLYERAIREWGLDPRRCVAVGDQSRDLIPARDVGVSRLYLLDPTRDGGITPEGFLRMASWTAIVEAERARVRE